MEYNNENNRFPKCEKLCGDRVIDELFARGTSFIRYPFRVTYLQRSVMAGEEARLRMMVSVGKKRFKRAVKRNRVKRQVREAYRLNKHALERAVEACGNEASMHVAFVFVGKELPESADVDRAVRGAIDKMVQVVSKKEVEA